jgi:DNA-binding transcriptional ArsR family regulator
MCAEHSERVSDQASTPPQKSGAEVQALLLKILANPLRGQIIMELNKHEASPKELAEALEEDFQRVCGQVRYLNKHGAIELVAEDSRRGGVQHIYRSLVRPRLDAEEWERLPLSVRESHSATTLYVIIGDAWQALLSQDFDSHRHRVLHQNSLLLDEQGMQEADESAEEHQDRLERIAASSAARRVASGEPAIEVKASTVIHPAAKPDR